MKRDIELLFELGTLRHLDRVWRQFGNPDVANIAEHIFKVAWIALTIAKKEKKGDHEKILKIALSHDVVESRTGDVHYISRQYTKRNETMAYEDIFEGTIHDGEMIGLIKEYEERKTIESQIVKDADYIDVELELCEMRMKGNLLGSEWTSMRAKNIYTKLYTATAKKMWKAIAVANPHDWHTRSPRNRFKSGDWSMKK